MVAPFATVPVGVIAVTRPSSSPDGAALPVTTVTLRPRAVSSAVTVFWSRPM